MKDLEIDKLSDESGQYQILLTCNACGHTRRCYPNALASSVGWDSKLSDVVKRLRCIKCGEKKCTAKAMREVAPHGYKSH